MATALSATYPEGVGSAARFDRYSAPSGRTNTWSAGDRWRATGSHTRCRTPLLASRYSSSAARLCDPSMPVATRLRHRSTADSIASAVPSGMALDSASPEWRTKAMYEGTTRGRLAEDTDVRS